MPYKPSLLLKHFPGTHNQLLHGKRAGANTNPWDKKTVTVGSARLDDQQQSVLTAIALAKTKDDIQDVLGLDDTAFTTAMGRLYQNTGNNTLIGAAVYGWQHGFITAKDLPGFENMVSPAYTAIMRKGKLDDDEVFVLQSVASQKTRRQIADDMGMQPIQVSQLLQNVATKWDDVLKDSLKPEDYETASLRGVDPFKLVLVGMRVGAIQEDQVAQERKEAIAAGRTRTSFVKDDAAGTNIRVTPKEKQMMNDIVFQGSAGSTDKDKSATSNLYARLGVNNHLAAAVRAVELGVVPKEAIPDREEHQTLNDKDRHMLQAIVDGDTVKGYGEKLGLTTGSISHRLKVLTNKWKVKSPTRVVARAYADGEITAPKELGSKAREFSPEDSEE